MVKRKQDTKMEESRKEDEISLKTSLGCRQSAEAKGQKKGKQDSKCCQNLASDRRH